MLVAGFDLKILEDQDENEYVVHAERFFDYVAGEKLEAGTGSIGRKDPQTEPNREQDPHRAFKRSHANRNRARAAMEDSQIEKQEKRYAGVEADPDCPRA